MAEKVKPETVRVREERLYVPPGAGGGYEVEQVRVIDVPGDKIPSGAEIVPDTTETHDWRSK